MIISRTPLRMSFIGGGTDLKSFYDHHYGCVVSTSINKYVYLLVNERFDKTYRIGYSRTEIVNKVSDIEHPLVRETLKLYGDLPPLEIISLADVHQKGTGLGSSSAFTVGLIKAMDTYFNLSNSKHSVADRACYIEIDKCLSPIGKQDQFAASYGGLKKYIFNADGSTKVSCINLADDLIKELNSSLLMFYTGIERAAGSVLEEQSQPSNVQKHINIYRDLVCLAEALSCELENNRIDNFGQYLHQGWILKSKLSAGITNSTIDDLYYKGIKAGATGGKVLGAGGGGFLLFFAPKERHNRIRESIGLCQYNFSFDPNGSSVISSNSIPWRTNEI